MEKYKLIKEYPGSPKLGHIDSIVNKIETGYYSDNPEYWEKVVELDYEILSYIHNGSKNIWKKDSKFETYFHIEGTFNPCTKLEDILKYPKIYLIYSVKRLSDNEIFTIGDNVLSKTCHIPNKILSIEIIENKIRIYPRNSFYFLNDIEHI